MGLQVEIHTHTNTHNTGGDTHTQTDTHADTHTETHTHTIPPEGNERARTEILEIMAKKISILVKVSP